MLKWWNNPAINFWTPAREERLRTLWATGMSCSKIARELGTSKGAVCGKAHRMKLERRAQAIENRWDFSGA